MNTEEKTEKQRQCWDCRFYKAYYTKGFSRFDNTKQGYCEKRGTIVAYDGYCEAWTQRIHRNNSQKTIPLKTLNNIAITITSILQILQEAEEEKNLNER